MRLFLTLDMFQIVKYKSKQFYFDQHKKVILFAHDLRLKNRNSFFAGKLATFNVEN